MDSVNKTLYIPLYGKAYVSQKERFVFRHLFAGGFDQKIYRLYEFRKA